METPSGSSETLCSEHVCKNQREILSLGCFHLTAWSVPMGKLPRTPRLFTQLLLHEESGNAGSLVPVGCADQPRPAGSNSTVREQSRLRHTLAQACQFHPVPGWVTLCSRCPSQPPWTLVVQTGPCFLFLQSCPLLAGDSYGMVWPGLVPGPVSQSGLSLALQGGEQMELFSPAGAVKNWITADGLCVILPLDMVTMERARSVPWATKGTKGRKAEGGVCS